MTDVGQPTHTPGAPKVSPARQEPLYRQIEAQLREAISNGAYPPGSRLPSEPELCDQYGVSRITVRHAIRNLLAEGLIVLDRGRGTFVRDRRLTAGIRGATSFSEEMRRLGRRAGARLLSLDKRRPAEEVAEQLDLDEGEEVVVVRRLRTGDDEVIGLQTAYLPARRVPGIELLDLEPESLYAVLDRSYGLIPVEAIETFRVGAAGADEAALLGVDPGECAFMVTRLTFGKAGPFELVESVMRGDRYQVRLALRQNAGH